jgi:hypothetical protein
MNFIFRLNYVVVLLVDKVFMLIIFDKWHKLI